MPDNPFSPLAPASPDVFVNREREVSLIFGHIRAVQRGNVAINGPLGIGKTSVLRYVAAPQVCLAHGVTAPTYAVLYIDVHSVSPFSAVHFWRRAVRLLSRLPEVGDALADPIAQILERATIDITDVEEFLDAVADREMALVMLLDEFEWVLQAGTPEAETESRNFLAQLASLARRAPRVLSLVVATEAPLSEAVKVIDAWRGSPFPTVFTSVTLRPLGRGDADRLLDQAAGGSTDAGSDGRERLFRVSGGQPAVLQAAAFALHEGRAQGLHGDRLWSEARRAAGVAIDDLAARPDPGPDTPRPAVASPAPSVPSAAPAAPGPVAPAGPTPPPGGLQIDPLSGDIWIGTRRLESLTALEYSLLRLLHERPGRLCSKEEIIRHVWGDALAGEVDDSRVEKLVSRLRRKIEPVPNRPEHIRTVRGRGYRFVP
jgi:hypothetical protein